MSLRFNSEGFLEKGQVSWKDVGLALQWCGWGTLLVPQVKCALQWDDDRWVLGHMENLVGFLQHNKIPHVFFRPEGPCLGLASEDDRILVKMRFPEYFLT